MQPEKRTPNIIQNEDEVDFQNAAAEEDAEVADAGAFRGIISTIGTIGKATSDLVKPAERE
jgi:hypothetical protein